MSARGISLLVLSAILFLFTSAGPAGGAVIRVPVDQPTIQAGIDAAAHGDTVLVADGVHSGPGNIELDPGGKAILIRSEKGADGCVIDCRGEGRGFYLHGAESRLTVIEGFTIKGGAAWAGGGIYGFWSSPEIRDCVITGCRADGTGGALHGEYFSARIVNCRFSGNGAGHGGAVYLCSGSLTNLHRCTISYNQAAVSGGGICCESGAKPVIEDCLFESNSALFGGGLCCEGSSPFIDRCVFTGNDGYDGGGVFLGPHAEPQLVCVELRSNKAECGGGAVYGCHALALLSNCLLADNLTLGRGGGLYGSHFQAELQLCTLSRNEAGQDGGGALSLSLSEVAVCDSILWGNGADQVETLEGALPLISHSDVEGGFGGEGNIDADPLFVDGPEGDCYLSQVAAGQSRDSPCLDAGGCWATEVCVPSVTPFKCRNPLLAGTRSDQGAESGVVDMGFHRLAATVDVDLRCLPAVGPLPLAVTFAASLRNGSDSPRRFAAVLGLETAAGPEFANWRQGWADIGAGQCREVRWPVNIPCLPQLQGLNNFHLAAMDVTPPPFNQPPYPPSGHTGIAACTVAGLGK